VTEDRERQLSTIELRGDVDFPSDESLEGRLQLALGLGAAIVVDLSDCTHLSVGVLRWIQGADSRATECDLPLIVVLPFFAAPAVRRLMLEIVPELTPERLVPSIVAARALSARAHPAVASDPQFALRASTLRAQLWRGASQTQTLAAERDVLLSETRALIADVRSRRVISAA
jgi:hypothetical protein